MRGVREIVAIWWMEEKETILPVGRFVTPLLDETSLFVILSILKRVYEKIFLTVCRLILFKMALTRFLT